MNPKQKDENAKYPKFKVPIKQSGVNTEDYDSKVDSTNGSANRGK